MAATLGRDQPYLDRLARQFVDRGSVATRVRGVLSRSVGGLVDRLSPGVPPGGEIRLSSVAPNRIAGRLTLGNAGLLFDSEVLDKRHPRATIRTLEQRELVDLRADERELTIRFGGGPAITRTTRADVATLGAGPRGRPPVTTPETVVADVATLRARPRGRSPAAAPAVVGAIQGDKRFVDEFFRSSEFALLPELSFALGLAGATGQRYRPSLALHSLGLSAAGFLGVDPARPGVTYRYKLPPELRRPDVRGLFDRFAPTDCWSGPDSGPNLEGLPTCPGPGGCESHPNRDNGCFGMCGAGCDCWSWICGDCCYHDFCADHDALLRSCDGAADVAFCVASVLVLPTWLLGCDHGWLWPF